MCLYAQLPRSYEVTFPWHACEKLHQNWPLNTLYVFSCIEYGAIKKFCDWRLTHIHVIHTNKTHTHYKLCLNLIDAPNYPYIIDHTHIHVCIWIDKGLSINNIYYTIEFCVYMYIGGGGAFESCSRAHTGDVVKFFITYLAIPYTF